MCPFTHVFLNAKSLSVNYGAEPQGHNSNSDRQEPVPVELTFYWCAQTMETEGRTGGHLRCGWWQCFGSNGKPRHANQTIQRRGSTQGPSNIPKELESLSTFWLHCLSTGSVLGWFSSHRCLLELQLFLFLAITSTTLQNILQELNFIDLMGLLGLVPH